MDTGTKISGAAHVALILVALFGGRFASEPLPFAVAEVSMVSAEEYAALVAPSDPVEEAPPEPAVAAEPTAPEVAEPEVAEEPEPEIVPEPETPDPPAPEIAEEEPPEIAVAEPDVVETPEPPAPSEASPDLERVAPEVVAAPEPEAAPDVEEQPEITQDDGAEVEQETQEATAPEAATDRISPDNQETATAAPARSIRPPTRRPSRPEPVETAAAEAPADTTAAVNDLLAEALSAEETSAPPAGPPLSAGEKDALRVAVSRCWNVGSLSSAALNTTVVVTVSMSQDGKPQNNTIRMLSSSGGDSGSAQQAYEAARRAIIRCGGSGFDLPVEKYAHWREIEMTFNPERMRIR